MSEQDVAHARRDPRVGVVLRVQYRNAGHLLVSYCTNLSRGGLFVPTSTPLAAGSSITLELGVGNDHATGSKVTLLPATVRWVRQLDASEGPAGMGLAFENVDALLGERIDSIVTDFTPLQVDIVGDHAAVRSHVAAQLGSLVTCHTTEHSTNPALAHQFARSDLVVVDTDSAPEEALALLSQLAALPAPPPRVALCDARNSGRRAQVRNFARVVTTPVDVDELRTSVLETVTLVRAVASEL